MIRSMPEIKFKSLEEVENFAIENLNLIRRNESRQIDIFSSLYEKLTFTEIKIFTLLKNKPMSKYEIEEIIYGGETRTTKTVNVHIHNLKKEIKEKGYEIYMARGKYTLDEIKT